MSGIMRRSQYVERLFGADLKTDNDKKLYHSTLAIRPKLIELIGKYSQRKGTSFSLVTCSHLLTHLR